MQEENRISKRRSVFQVDFGDWCVGEAATSQPLHLKKRDLHGRGESAGAKDEEGRLGWIRGSRTYGPRGLEEAS